MRYSVARYLAKLVFISLFIAFPFFSPAQKVKIGTAPSWIKKQGFDAAESIAPAQISNGFFYMLIDQQVDVKSKSYYYHYAYKVVSQTGVQNNSELVFNYDPAYQKFVLHDVIVIRKGERLSKTRTSRITDMQREKDLENHLYDESRSVVVVLDDIRPGDVVEYDYTLSGDNPVFRGVFSYSFYYSLSYELLNFYCRIVNDPAQKVKISYYKKDVPPVVSENKGKEEWVWEMKHIAGVQSDENAPGWYEQFPYVDMSGHSSWKEVEDWAFEVFKNNDPLSPELKKIIDTISQDNPRPFDKIMAVLHFVQDEIRYFGVEIGVNSHKPASPVKVLKQRFGDCKDKALLFCRMLREMEIEAWPALVNSTKRREILHYLPSPSDFNHAIAFVKAGGREFWFDPTLSDQGGDITNYFIPHYGAGLIIDGKRTGLDSIPPGEYTSTEVTENFWIQDMNGKASMTIITEYHGDDADYFRSYLASNSLEDISKKYVDYYTENYGPTKVIKDMEFDDHKKPNILILREYYEIENIWNSGDSVPDEKERKAYFYAHLVKDNVSNYKPAQGKRTSPLYLGYPIDYIHNIHVTLPEDWEITPGETKITNEFFYFKNKISYESRNIDLHYEYKTLRDYVPAEESKRFLSDMDKLQDNISFRIFYNKPSVAVIPAKTPNWILIFLAILFLAATAFFCFRLYQKKTTDLAAEEDFRESLAIGGWLVLPLIGLFLNACIMLIALLTFDFFDISSWDLLTKTDSASYSAAWAPTILVELITYIFAFCFSILLIVLFFKKDHRVPKFMVIFYAVFICFHLFELIVVASVSSDRIGEQLQGFVRSLIAGGIWIPYFLVSERVKNTFIRK